MGIFRPTAIKERVTDVTPDFIKSLGVRALLLDVDNTLATYTSHQPIPGAVEWARQMKAAGFRLIIISNNFEERVKPFADMFGLDFLSFAIKPLPIGYLRAAGKLGVKRRDCVIIGDQIFHRCSRGQLVRHEIRTVDTHRTGGRGLPFKARRYFERDLRKKIPKPKGCYAMKNPVERLTERVIHGDSKNGRPWSFLKKKPPVFHPVPRQ